MMFLHSDEDREFFIQTAALIVKQWSKKLSLAHRLSPGARKKLEKQLRSEMEQPLFQLLLEVVSVSPDTFWSMLLCKTDQELNRLGR